MAKKGENKFGLKVEDFPSYEDYLKEYKRLFNNTDKAKAKRKEYSQTEKGKQARYRAVKIYEKTEKGKIANKKKRKKYRQSEHGIANEKAYYLANKDKILANQKAWWEANPKRRKELAQAYYSENRDKILAYSKTYKKENRKSANAREAKRRSALLERIPSWSDLDAIKKFYEDCPQGYAVDHIIPLQGKLVSGLHVLENLQYLTKSENSAKGHSFDIEDQEKYF